VQANRRRRQRRFAAVEQPLEQELLLDVRHQPQRRGDVLGFHRAP